MTTIADNEPKGYDPRTELLRRAVEWRTAAGWVAVAILIWNYLAHPMASAIMVANGAEPLQPLPEIEWTDVLAVIGIPIGGAFADRMAQTGSLKK